MIEPTHYHQRIRRATERLAQLQARELLANQRHEAKAREVARREERKRRHHLAELIVSTGAHVLEDTEIRTLLITHMRDREKSLH